MRALVLLLLTSCDIGLSAAATLPPVEGDGAYCQVINEGYEICRTDEGKVWGCHVDGVYWSCTRVQ